MTFTGHLA